MPDIWDDPDMKVGGDYIKFNEPGDTAIGEVLHIGKKQWDDGSVAPTLLLRCDDGEERTVTAGQVQLKAQLAEKRPQVGDRVRIEFTEVEKRAGGKTLKHFKVDVKKVEPAVSAEDF